MEQLKITNAGGTFIDGTTDCRTAEDQLGTGDIDCLKTWSTKFLRLNEVANDRDFISSHRKPWPTSMGPDATEDEACRTAMGWDLEGVKIWTGWVADGESYYADAVYTGSYSYPWNLHPASRVAFCQYNSYVTTYTAIAPQLHPNGDPAYSPAYFPVKSFIYGDPGVFDLTAGWSVSTRGYWAWPFTVFSLSDEDRTSTRNIGVFVFKRSVTKSDKLTGGSDGYNVKNVQCYTSDVDFADTDYPSQVGTSQLNAFLASTKTLCTDALHAKVVNDISAFIASQ